MVTAVYVALVMMWGIGDSKLYEQIAVFTSHRACVVFAEGFIDRTKKGYYGHSYTCQLETVIAGDKT